MQEIVSQIMTRHVVTINSNRTALDAALLMKEKRISSLIVQDDENESLGIITERDFVKRVCAQDKKSSEVVISDGRVIGIITVTDLAKELRRIMLTKGIVELID